MFGDVIKERGFLTSSLVNILDADGRQLKFDIREDELQNEKLDEIVELLIAAGYFRARIKGLPVFDKVVGGIVWCIGFCDYDLDIDLLYHENLSIGQKIGLTEKIVLALTKLQCPVALEPHQIQGLDCIRIFPVIQWLVRKSVEARQQSKDAIQSFAERQFVNMMSVNASSVSTPKPTISTPIERLYKNRKDFSCQSEFLNVQSTVMEYEGTTTEIKSENERLATNRRQKDNAHNKSISLECDNEQTILQQSLAELDKRNLEITVSVLSMISTESALLASSFPQCQISDEKYHESRKLNDVASVEETVELEKVLEDVKGKTESVLKEIETIQETKRCLLIRNEEYDNAEKAESSRKLEVLREYLDKYDEIKKREQDFKTRCKAEASTLEVEKEALMNTSRMDSPNETTEALIIKQSQQSNVLKESRKKLARLNAKLAIHRRKLDDVPSSLELNQYQYRFIDLYNDIASLQMEMKTYYTLYNTLCDVKTYLEKQIGLLDSVYDAYERGMSSDRLKSQFIAQLEQTYEGLKQTRSNVSTKFNAEQSKRDNLRCSLQELVDRQRFYHKVDVDFQQECKKNEMLHKMAKEFYDRSSER